MAVVADISTLRVALAGNPNAGKTSLFNALTGQRQSVGNYPGVTVEKREGIARHGGIRFSVVDLPGTYSLTACSPEEQVVLGVLREEPPAVVIDVLDASNLERNLYLAVQLMECGLPLVLALNMSDIAYRSGLRIKRTLLSRLLGLPAARTIGHRGKGVRTLMALAARTATQGATAVAAQRTVDYGRELEPHIGELTQPLAPYAGSPRQARWLAVRLLEDDPSAARRLEALCPPEAHGQLLARAAHLRAHIQRVFGQEACVVLARQRYGFVAGLCAECVSAPVRPRYARSDRIDAVLMNRYLALPIFAVLMLAVFQLTFLLGNPLVRLLGGWKDQFAQAVRDVGDPSRLVLPRSLLADGIIEGAGSVLQFVPLIALLYLAISVLEDTGYMARAAFILDRLLHRAGLHGKAFIPMLVGFGCTVPAVLSTRILESRRDRLVTMLVLPLISCGARLPVYSLILGAFFADTVLARPLGLEVRSQGVWLFGIYAAGIALAIGTAKLLGATVLREQAGGFVMELPPYRLPTPRGLAIHVAERTYLYVRKAGTVILAIVIVLWAMKTWPMLPAADRQAYQQQRAALRAAASAVPAPPADFNEQLLAIDRAEHAHKLEHSAIGRIGRAIAPAMRPAGLDWRLGTALLGALAAKEVFVSQMGVIYAVGQHGDRTPLTEHLRHDYRPLQGLCILIFVLVACPCAGTVAATWREAGSWKWAAAQWLGLTAMAWMLAVAVYQAGLALGI